MQAKQGWRSCRFMVVVPIAVSLLMALSPSQVWAADTLVVTVEVAPDQSLSPDEIRAEIALVVGRKVLRAAARDAGEAGDSLVIDVDEGRVVMEYRSQQGEIRRRSVEFPPSREEDLEAIHWLAMNLAKERLDGTPPSPEAKRQAARPHPGKGPHLPNPYYDEPRDNPFVRVDPQVAGGSAPSDRGLSPRWRVAAYGGFALVRRAYLEEGALFHDVGFRQRLEVELQAAFARLSLGLALTVDAGPGQGGGAALFLGDGWRWGKLRVDRSVGAGVWAFPGIFRPIGPAGGEVVLEKSRLRPFGKVTGTALYALYPWLDGTFRMSLNVGLFALKESNLAGLLGLRITL